METGTLDFCEFPETSSEVSPKFLREFSEESMKILRAGGCLPKIVDPEVPRKWPGNDPILGRPDVRTHEETQWF